MGLTEGSEAVVPEVNITYELHALHVADDLQSILLVSVSVAARLAGAERALLILFEPSANELTVAERFGDWPEKCAEQTGPICAIVARVLQMGRGPAAVLGVDVDGVGLAFESAPVATLSVAPLWHKGHPLGAILLAFSHPAPNEVDQDPRLALFLEHTAVAIARALPQDYSPTSIDKLRSPMTDFTSKGEFDPEAALDHLIQRLNDLVDGEVGSVMLYDPETAELVTQRVSARAGGFRQGRMPLHDPSQTVRVFLTGQPIIFDRDFAYPKEKRRAEISSARNSVMVPLEVGGRRIGVVTFLNKRDGNFDERDIRLLQHFASYLGLLMHNARLLREEQHRVASLQQLNQVVEDQREGLRRTLAFHDGLTKMVLDGRGSAAICTTLSQLLTDDILLFDRFGHQLGSAIVNECCEVQVHNGEYPTLAATLAGRVGELRAVRLAPIPELSADKSVVAAPVVVGGETLAWLCVVENARQLDQIDLMHLERAATVIAIQLMTEKVAAEVRYKLHGDLVAELLSGSGTGWQELRSQAAYLGVDLNALRRVLLLEVDDFDTRLTGFDATKVMLLRSKFLGIVERACRRHDPILAPYGSEIVVLARSTVATEYGDGELQRLGDEIRAEIRNWSSGVTVSIGIGTACKNLEDYRLSYQRARCAIDVIRAARQHDRVVMFEQLGIVAVLFDSPSRERLLATMEDTIGKLVDYDRRHCTQLVETLNQYLFLDCSRQRAAQALCVHINTLRYRLSRIEDVLGRSLAGAGTKFDLQFALKVWYTLQPSGS